MEKNIYQRQQQNIQRQMSAPRYCRFCGKPLLLSSIDEHNRPNPNYMWEWENRAHYSCAQKDYVEKTQGRRG